MRRFEGPEQLCESMQHECPVSNQSENQNDHYPKCYTKQNMLAPRTRTTILQQGLGKQKQIQDFSKSNFEKTKIILNYLSKKKQFKHIGKPTIKASLNDRIEIIYDKYNKISDCFSDFHEKSVIKLIDDYLKGMLQFQREQIVCLDCHPGNFMVKMGLFENYQDGYHIDIKHALVFSLSNDKHDKMNEKYVQCKFISKILSTNNGLGLYLEQLNYIIQNVKFMKYYFGQCIKLHIYLFRRFVKYVYKLISDKYGVVQYEYRRIGHILKQYLKKEEMECDKYYCKDNDERFKLVEQLNSLNAEGNGNEQKSNEKEDQELTNFISCLRLHKSLDPIGNKPQKCREILNNLLKSEGPIKFQQIGSSVEYNEIIQNSITQVIEKQYYQCVKSSLPSILKIMYLPYTKTLQGKTEILKQYIDCIINQKSIQKVSERFKLFKDPFGQQELQKLIVRELNSRTRLQLVFKKMCFVDVIRFKTEQIEAMVVFPFKKIKAILKGEKTFQQFAAEQCKFCKIHQNFNAYKGRDFGGIRNPMWGRGFARGIYQANNSERGNPFRPNS